MPINDDTLMVRGGKGTSLTTLPTDEYEEMKEKAAKWDTIVRIYERDCNTAVPPCHVLIAINTLTKKEDRDA